MRNPANVPKVMQAGQWYDIHRSLHERLAEKIRRLMEELLSGQRIQFHRVESRVKERQSFLDKAARRKGNKLKYSAPTKQIKDIVGIRIITYLDSTVTDVCEIIKANFKIDRLHSNDKDEALGADRVGYRSKHYVASLTKAREKLAEYKEFTRVPFEFQVRSLLQHAWAEVEHDRRFKYPGELPLEIRRRYSLIAGQLELADRELNNLASEIESMTANAARDAKNSRSIRDLDVEALTSYMRGRFESQIQDGLMAPSFNGFEHEILRELSLFGITNLRSLAQLLDKSSPIVRALSEEQNANFLGFLRNAMMAKDAERYFSEVWQKVPRRWVAMGSTAADILESQGIEIRPILKQYKVAITEGFD